MDTNYDVVIVGAGAAGIGCAKVLQDLGVERYTVLERHEIGASFRRWPEGMRFITPSFTSNNFGMLDLNAVILNTSPAYALKREHPIGEHYGMLLQSTAEYFELPVRTGVDVCKVIPNEDGFTLDTSAGPITSRFVIWAAGEFQYPWLKPFPGAEHCIHNSQVKRWKQIKQSDPIVIGGYESGMDAAIRLARLGKKVRVLERMPVWESEASDPSVALSPYTHERLAKAKDDGRLKLIGGAGVAEVRPGKKGFDVITEAGDRYRTSGPPILATGFVSSLWLVADHFDWRDDGWVKLTDADESTTTPGLFVSGPMVRHENVIFCFIYKFRQRFAVVGNAIAGRLGLDTSVLQRYRERGMYLDDLSCCGETCEC